MSLPKPDLHIRLDGEAKSKLDLLAEVMDVPSSTLAASILDRAILGEAHALMVAAKRAMKAGFIGNDDDRDSANRALSEMRRVLGVRRG